MTKKKKWTSGIVTTDEGRMGTVTFRIARTEDFHVDERADPFFFDSLASWSQPDRAVSASTWCTVTSLCVLPFGINSLYLSLSIYFPFSSHGTERIVLVRLDQSISTIYLDIYVYCIEKIEPVLV